MNQSGYIALVSSIIISILLLMVTFAISSSNLSGRFNVLNAEFKERSLALAEACVDTALLKLAQNQSYSGNENIFVGNDQCSILAVETLSGQKIIKTKAIFQNSVTNLKITAQASDLSVISWEEMPKF
jgi:hypothetical protein